MTIRRGQSWGEAGGLATGAPVAHDDAGLAAIVGPVVLGGTGVAVEAGLLGGDLCRTVAGPGDAARLHTPDAQRLPIDVGVVTLDDGDPQPFVAHVVVGHRWHGRLVAVMNAQFVGRYDVAPRSHPNDGRVDVLDATLAPGDRFKAWRRLPTGMHVPHPGIVERRVAELVLDLDRPLPVYVDGRRRGRARHVVVRVVPDAATIVI